MVVLLLLFEGLGECSRHDGRAVEVTAVGDVAVLRGAVTGVQQSDAEGQDEGDCHADEHGLHADGEVVGGGLLDGRSSAGRQRGQRTRRGAGAAGGVCRGLLRGGRGVPRSTSDWVNRLVKTWVSIVPRTAKPSAEP